MKLKHLKSLIFWTLPVILMIWWRGHTFGPTVLEKTGLHLWPVVTGRSEPLDCDESAYGYMGRRQVEGAVLYRDLTEYKPPLGYWFYAVGVGVGGASEMTIRLMIIPVLIANMWLIASILFKLSGRFAAWVGMIVFILVSTDPYVYGNGSNLEHLMNLGLTAAIFSVFQSEKAENPWRWWVFAGIAVGMSSAVKQVCLLGLIPLMIYEISQTKELKYRIKNIAYLLAGFMVPWLIVGLILWSQGALMAAWTDVVQYSRALAANTPPDANAPPGFYRWLTGNADPRNGRLPWPFGRTDWLVWWGTGSWPIVIASAFVTIAIMIRKKANGNQKKLIAGMWLMCWGMIVLPGLYWQHYYMLLGPGSALLIGLSAGSPITRRLGVGFLQLLLAMAIISTIGIQVRSYLMVPAEQLTVKYKGGAQWVSLRLMSEDIERRIESWSPRPRMEMWGWQSPVLFYVDLDAPSAYFFTDPLMKAFALKGHPQVQPRLEQLTKDLESKRPELVFCGDIPFPRLKTMLDQDYLASPLVPSAPDGRGFFVRKDLYQKFHAPEFQQSKVR